MTVKHIIFRYNDFTNSRAYLTLVRQLLNFPRCCVHPRNNCWLVFLFIFLTVFIVGTLFYILAVIYSTLRPLYTISPFPHLSKLLILSILFSKKPLHALKAFNSLYLFFQETFACAQEAIPFRDIVHFKLKFLFQHKTHLCSS